MYIHALRYTVAVPVCEQGLFGTGFFPWLTRLWWNISYYWLSSRDFFMCKSLPIVTRFLVFISHGGSMWMFCFKRSDFPTWNKIIKSVFKRATVAHYHEKKRFSWRKLVDDYFPIRSKGFTFMSVFPTENLGHWTKGFFSRIFVKHDVFSKTNVQK